MMKNIGKPCAGKPHARFDEGREVQNLLPTLPKSLGFDWGLFYAPRLLYGFKDGLDEQR